MTRPGPVAPRRTDTSVLNPVGLDDVRLAAGFWGDRQARNRTVTIPHIRAWLEKGGSLDNLRGRPHRGMLFADSDVYKWLEALGWEGTTDPEVVALIAAAQEPDGYLNTYYRSGTHGGRWSDLAFGHELYCLGHLAQAAVAEVRGAGGTTLLGVTRRFADLSVDVFAENGFCGHPEVETALVELYRTTGDDRYLTLALRFLDRRGYGSLGAGRFGAAYYQDEMPVRDARTMRGHAVRALYLATGMVDVYVETGDRSLLDAAITQWDAAVATKTYLTGGQGSRHLDESFGDDYELPSDRAYAETCAGIAGVMLCWRLLLATGDAQYADHMERTLYNVVAASTAEDGRHFTYVNPLHRRNAGPARQEWFDCACCPPNLARLLSSLHTYAVTTDMDGVQIHQYFAGTVNTILADGRRVAFAVETGYPSAGRITVRIVRSDGGPWTLRLRVPRWTDPDAGYARHTRDWRPGDAVTLDLDMTPRQVFPHPRVDALRGSAAFQRGPLIYCLEQADQPDVNLSDVAAVGDAVDRGGVLEIPGVVHEPGSQLYRTRPSTSDPERPVTLVAMPYHAWGNRVPGAMRVWVPLAAHRDRPSTC